MKRAWLAALGIPFLAFACADEVTTRGQLMLVFQTDMRLPEDVDQVRLEISRLGKIEFAQTYEVGAGAAKMPATLGILGGENAAIPYQIRLMALREGKPEVLRQATTTIPSNRIAQLRMPLYWLCFGESSVTGATPEAAVNTCGEGKTCSAGECIADQVDSATLPDYNPRAIFGGSTGDGTGACFDVDTCLPSTLQRLEPLNGSVTVGDAAAVESCAVPKPDVPLSESLNVGIFVRPGGDICSDNGCVIPLDFGDSSGWTLSNDTIRLPQAVCDLANRGKVDVMVSYGCNSKVEGVPTCGPWSSTGASSPTADASAQSASEGGPLLADTLSPVTHIAISGAGLSARAYFTTEDGAVSACDASGCQTRIVFKTASSVKQIAGTPTHFIYSQPDTSYDFLYRCSFAEPLSPCVSFAHKTPGEMFGAAPEGVDTAAYWFDVEGGVRTLKGALAGVSNGLGSVRYQVPVGVEVNSLRVSSAEIAWIEDGGTPTLLHCAKPSGEGACAALSLNTSLGGMVPESLVLAGAHATWRTVGQEIMSLDLRVASPSPVKIGSGAISLAAMDRGVFVAKDDRSVRFLSYEGKETRLFTAAGSIGPMVADDTTLFYATVDRKLWRYTHGR